MMDMERIYGARDPVEAEFVKGLLESEEIEAVIQGLPLQMALGDIPISPESLPSVWVNEPDVARARQIVDEMQRGGPAASVAGETWTCPRCGEVMEGQFTTCWKCGTERAGTASV
jgi:hypothetical protein